MTGPGGWLCGENDKTTDTNMEKYWKILIITHIASDNLDKTLFDLKTTNVRKFI